MNTERMKKANAYHDRGFNCSQSVLAAFADVTGLSEGESFRIAAGFGRGFFLAVGARMTFCR